MVIEMSEVVVAWVSRHPPLRAQLADLHAKFKVQKIEHISKTFKDANEVCQEIRAVNAKVAVVVLPLSMIARLLETCKDVTFLWAEMQGLHECNINECKEFQPDTDVWLPLHGSDKGRHMRFIRFNKIKAIKMELEPL